MIKTLKWTIILILFDMIVGTAIMYFFDIKKFAEQYADKILLGIFGIGIIWISIKKYRNLCFIDKKDGVRIQFIEARMKYENSI